MNIAEIVVARRTGLLEAMMDGELIGLHVANGTCYSFNGPATRIWALIEQPRTIADLCATLTREYDVDAQTCQGDVMAVLDDLAADSIVELRRPAT